jgi:hypothetical protein
MLDNPKMKSARLTIALLACLAAITGGCSSLSPSVTSYFDPSPSDEINQGQALQNYEKSDEGGGFFILQMLYPILSAFGMELNK